MKKRLELKKNQIKSLAPCFLLSALAGIITGAWIFVFKIAASYIIELSQRIYGCVRENPVYLPLLLLGAGVLGIAVYVILRLARECRGGGIPTAVASIRGLVPLKWIQGSLVLFVSSLLTFLGGVPLGNEGPSVQMGASVGKFTSDLCLKKDSAWDRYIMTGGACAGFAAATCAPLTGMLFALEEAHRRFSPLLFTVASVSVIMGSVTHRLLSSLFGVDVALFDISISEMLPFENLWICVIIGTVCGVCAVLLTRLYNIIRKASFTVFKRIPTAVKILTIFVVAATVGFFSGDFIGSGHSLIERIFMNSATWYILLPAFAIRAILMIGANNEGVSGGVFLPTLTFGAIISSLIVDLLIYAGAVGAEHYPILISVGMVSFLAASSRTPITAFSFAAEVLCGVGNILPVGVGVIISYIIAEASGLSSFTDTVMEAKIEAWKGEKEPIIIDTHMTVVEGAFADGKALRDILWPPTCTILSIERIDSDFYLNSGNLRAGDVLHLHYQTYDGQQTLQSLSAILGNQPNDPYAKAHPGGGKHVVPED